MGCFARIIACVFEHFFLLVFLWVGLNVYVYTKEVDGEIDDYFHDDVDVDSCNCDDSDISTYLITIF